MHLLTRLLAMVLPIAVLAPGLAVILAVEPEVADLELERAGQVVNGAVVGPDAAVAIDMMLAAAQPRVLVLGNSLANTNIDPDALARQLDLAPRDVAVVTVPNSIASHWYAILANRVFSAGHRPELVVVISSLHAMLLVEPYSEASRTSLIVQMEANEPVLDAYVRREPPWLERWRAQRLRWRQSALDTLRDESVALVMGGDTQEAMDRLFAGVQPDPAEVMTGGALVDVRAEHHAAWALPSPDRSLLGPLADLVAAHDAELVLVRSPTAPNLPKKLRDQVPANVEAEVARLVAARGQTFFDAIDVALPADAFANPRHMTLEGARQFTRILGPDLRAAWADARAE